MPAVMRPVIGRPRVLAGLHDSQLSHSEGKQAQVTKALIRSDTDTCLQTVVLQPEDTVPREVVQQHTIVLISELPLRARQPFESPGLAPHDVPTGHKGWLSSRGDEW